MADCLLNVVSLSEYLCRQAIVPKFVLVGRQNKSAALVRILLSNLRCTKKQAKGHLLFLLSVTSHHDVDRNNELMVDKTFFFSFVVTESKTPSIQCIKLQSLLPNRS